MHDIILIRYGELTTKGKNRMIFINQLKQNVQTNIKDFKDATIQTEYDRMFVHLNGHDGMEVLSKIKDVFGIHSFSLVSKVERDAEKIADFANELVQAKKPKTFKVVAKRNDKSFPIISDDLKRIVATKILKNNNIKVDVHDPEMNIYVEVRYDGVYITSEKIPGQGGFPLGIGGKVMMMMSGGIDSPVAAYMLMRKGVSVEFVHFATPPHTTEESLFKVFDLVKILKKYGGNLKLHVVDFTPIQNEIFCASKDAYRITIMRRFFYRIAEKLAWKNKCLAIANGESVGQVASQTLESMLTINNVTSMTVLRPLTTYDKQEIIKIAKEIGTYETSIIAHEDCCSLFVPENPATKPRIDIAQKQEHKMFIDGLIESTIENTKTYEF